jgi:hypothetical protein
VPRRGRPSAASATPAAERSRDGSTCCPQTEGLAYRPRRINQAAILANHSVDGLQKALASEEGKAATADLANFTDKGTVTAFASTIAA